MARWSKTDRAVQAALDIARRSKVWSLALDAPLISRSDLVGRLLADSVVDSRSAAYRVVNTAIDDGLLVAVEGDSLAPAESHLTRAVLNGGGR